MAFLMVGFGMNARGAYRQSQEQTAIRVGSHEIAQERYYREVEQLTEAYRNQLGANFGNLKNFLNIEQRAIDSLIEEYVLQDYIDSLGLTASTAQVEGYIAQLPFFQKFGLTRETYNSFLQAQGMTGESLEAKTRQELGGLQLQSILGDLSQPTDRELRSVFREQNTKFDFEYLSFRPDDYKGKVVAPSDEQLAEYFKSHADAYRQPRSVRYSYLKFDPEKYLNKVEVTEEDVRELYNAKQSQLFEPKQIKVRQIIINKEKEKGSAVEELVSGKEAASQPSAANAAKKARADEVVTKLQAGEDFAKLAGAYSEDPATKDKGGDRGWLLPTELDKDVRSVADRVLKGKFSNVIDTENQYVIVYVEDIKERRTKPFEDVRAGLELELRSQDAPEYSHVAAEREYRRWQDDSVNRALNLLDFAKKEQLSAVDTGKLLPETEDPADAPGLTKKIASLSQGDHQVIRVGTSDYLLEILETKDSYIPELSAVRAKLVEAYTSEQSRKLAKDAAEKTLAMLTGPDSGAEKRSVADAAKSLSLGTKSTGLISRADPGKEPLVMQPDAKKLLFSLDDKNSVVKKVISGPAGDFVVAGLKARVTPGDDEFSSSLSSLRTQEKQTSHSRVGNFVYQSLRASADVWVNPKLLESSRFRS